MISLSDHQRGNIISEDLQALDDDDDTQTQVGVMYSASSRGGSFRTAPTVLGSAVSDDEASGDDIDDDAHEVTAKVARTITNCSCTKALDSKQTGNQKRRLKDLLEQLLADPTPNT